MSQLSVRMQRKRADKLAKIALVYQDAIMSIIEDGVQVVYSEGPTPIPALYQAMVQHHLAELVERLKEVEGGDLQDQQAVEGEVHVGPPPVDSE